VGPARAAARGDPERLPADAAARPEHGRLRHLPDQCRRRLRRRGGRVRHRRLPDLRRAQRRRADGARDPGGREPGARRGDPVLHGRPARPRRAHLHPRPLPAGRRGRGRRRRARAVHQGHGRPAAPPAAHALSPRCASASTRRCTCTPTTPPAASSRPTWRRSRRASTRSTGRPRRCRADQPAEPGRARRRHRPLARATGLSTLDRSSTSSPTGRRSGGSTRRSRRACAARPAPSTATRSPAGSCRTCASRRSRSASATASRRSRTLYARCNDLLGGRSR
jgi:hypothetical protein